MFERIVRFRADPSKVRIRVRRVPEGWTVRIDGSHNTVYHTHKSPKKALVLALRMAEEVGMKGIDLGMQLAYRHPFPVGQ